MATFTDKDMEVIINNTAHIDYVYNTRNEQVAIILSNNSLHDLTKEINKFIENKND